MGSWKVSSAIVLLSLLFTVHSIHCHAKKAEEGTIGVRTLLSTIDCGILCAGRCKLSSRPNLCHRACGTCCARCNCVPPGTAGNRETCPCYARMTTHGGRLKCP